MGVALPRPSGLPNIAEKFLKPFIDHKLLDGEGILKKYQFNFCQKWVWSCHAPQSDPIFF